MHSPRKFLFLHHGALGDFILALPSFESIHSKFPTAAFTLIGNTKNANLIAQRPYLKRTISKDRGELACLFTMKIQPQTHINAESVFSCMRVTTEHLFQPCWFTREINLDRVYSLLGGPFEKAFLFGQSNLPIVAQNLKHMGLKTVYQIRSFPYPEKPQKVTDFIYEQLFSQGLRLKREKVQIEPDPDEKKKGFEYASELKRRFRILVALHPGSGSLKNIWPIPCWKTIIRYLAGYETITQLLLFGPADKQVFSKLKFLQEIPNLLIIQDWPLPRLVGLLEQVSLFIGNDSGITHLAAVLGIPTVAIFGQSDPLIWAPQGPRVKVVKTAWTVPWNLENKVTCPLNDIPEEIIKVIESFANHFSYP